VKQKGASDFTGEEFEHFEFNAFQWCSNINLVAFHISMNLNLNHF